MERKICYSALPLGRDECCVDLPDSLEIVDDPVNQAFRSIMDEELQKQIDAYTSSVRNDYPSTSSNEDCPPKSLVPKREKWDASVKSGENVSPKEGENWEKKFALQNDRYLTVSKFRSSYRVHIRDFYKDKTGQVKPTKTGIALTLDEWKKLQLLTKDVNEVLRSVDNL